MMNPQETSLRSLKLLTFCLVFLCSNIHAPKGGKKNRAIKAFSSLKETLDKEPCRFISIREDQNAATLFGCERFRARTISNGSDCADSLRINSSEEAAAMIFNAFGLSTHVTRTLPTEVEIEDLLKNVIGLRLHQREEAIELAMDSLNRVLEASR